MDEDSDCAAARRQMHRTHYPVLPVPVLQTGVPCSRVVVVPLLLNTLVF
jgi:hypothetical protein